MYRSQYDEEPVGEPYSSDVDLYVSSPAPKRRRRIVAVASLVALLAGAGAGAVVVDRIAAARAESRTAEAFQEGMTTPQRPSVHVSGFPVLTQLASGSQCNPAALPRPRSRCAAAQPRLRASELITHWPP